MGADVIIAPPVEVEVDVAVAVGDMSVAPEVLVARLEMPAEASLAADFTAALMLAAWLCSALFSAPVAVDATDSMLEMAMEASLIADARAELSATVCDESMLPATEVADENAAPASL